jgi:hypothetical protein
MKSCPKCNRTFPDEGQKFCTFDGGLLIAPQTFDPNATIRATSVDLVAPVDKATSRELPDPNATIVEHYPGTVALPRDTGPTGTPNTADITPPPPPPSQPPPPPIPPPPAVQVHPPTAPVSPPSQPLPQTPPSAQAAAPAAPVKKGSKMPLIIAGILVVLLLGGGGLAALFFFVVKPRLDERAANQNTEIQPNTNTQTPPVETPAPSPSPSVAETFTPPADSVQFVNSKEQLDGKLAEHYFDFSFYYPKGWTKDPKAGVAGATNFVLVERALPPKLTQERFAVGWYTSTGTVVGDLPGFPKRIEEFSNSLAKQFDEYKKVSEGPTKVNSLDGFEFRWMGSAEIPDRGPVQLWGRVVFLPTGNEGDTAGATLIMFSTSLAPELLSVDDLGSKGEAQMILESFRFGKKN